MAEKLSAALNDSDPVVSVIIPSYNTAHLIVETLTSVFAQTFRMLEVIVVNDGSPDSEVLEQVLRPFIDRITYLRQRNEGLAAARNAGIRAARGHYLALLDSDDLWLPTFLESQIAFLRANPQFDLVYSDAEFFGDTPRAGQRFTALSPSTGPVTLESLLSLRCTVVASSVVAKKSVFMNVGMFDPTHRACAEDWECWTRLVKGGVRIGYQREALIRYRIRSSSLSANRSAMQEGALLALSKLEALGPLAPAEERAATRFRNLFESELELERGKRHLADATYPAARGSFLAVAKQHPSRKVRWKGWCLVLGLTVAPAITRLVANRAQTTGTQH